MTALTKDEIIKGLKENGKDPRITKEMEFEQESVYQGTLTKLRGGTDLWHFISLGNQEIPVRLLSIKEKNDILMETHKWYNEIPEVCRAPELWVRKHAFLTLLKAMTSCSADKDGNEFFINEQTLEEMPNIHFNQLFRLYSDLEVDLDPTVESLSDEEYRSLVGDLEGKQVHSLNGLSRYRLALIVLRLYQDAKLLTGKSPTHS